ncbi:hypothetical protein HDU98_008763 [Podochytrium sp. JEL0797]|nr:hypothetical protein HDU98_008763 [Podochytrium sp. JEL0797]
MKIDEAIQRADTLLARGQLQTAYQHYMSAIALIAAHLVRETTFCAVDGKRWRNEVTARPADSERLFGLAHLWWVLCLLCVCAFLRGVNFTEAEDILNGEVDFDGIVTDDEDDDSESETESIGLLPLVHAIVPDTTTIHELSEPIISTDIVDPAFCPLPLGKPQSVSLISGDNASHSDDFRTHRLTRPRSICSSIRSSVRLSVMVLKDDPVDIAILAPDPAPVQLPVAPPIATATLPMAHKLSLPAAYTPLIPSSPLQQQHQHLLHNYTRCKTELDMLNSKTTTSSTMALQSLQHVRRLLETSTLLKPKLSSVAAEISRINQMSLLDFSPKEIAINITLCDWELFGEGVGVRDLVWFTQTNPAVNVAYTDGSGAMTPSRSSFTSFTSQQQQLHNSSLGIATTSPAGIPRSFKSCMDFSIFLTRLVSSTILSPSSSSGTTNSSTKVLSHWLQVLHLLHTYHRNFQSTHAVLSGLLHPSVSRVIVSRACVSRLTVREVQVLESAVSVLDPVDSFQRCRDEVKRIQQLQQQKKVGWGLVPLVGVFVDDLKRLVNGGGGGAGRRRSGSLNGSVVPLVKQQENVMLEFAGLQGSFEMWRGGGGSVGSGDAGVGPSGRLEGGGAGVYAAEKKERNNQVIHWLLSRGWVAEEQLWEMSVRILSEGQEGGDLDSLEAIATPPSVAPSAFPASPATPTLSSGGIMRRKSNMSIASSHGATFLDKLKRGIKKGGNDRGSISAASVSLPSLPSESSSTGGGFFAGSDADPSELLARVFKHVEARVARDPNDHVYLELMENGGEAGDEDNAGVGGAGGRVDLVAIAVNGTSVGESLSVALAPTVSTPVSVQEVGVEESEKLSIDGLRARLDKLKMK